MIASIKKISLLRIFTTDKLIKSPFLNKIGLQIWRIKLADLIFRLKAKHVNDKYDTEISNYLHNGYIKFDEFLSPKEFAEVKSECVLIKETEDWRKYGRKDGPNQIFMFDLNKLDRKKYPAILKFLFMECLAKYMQNVKAKKNRKKAYQLLLFSSRPQKSIDMLHWLGCCKRFRWIKLNKRKKKSNRK